MLLKITESLPRKSAVSPVYNSPPIGRQIRGNLKKRSLVLKSNKEITGVREKKVVVQENEAEDGKEIEQIQ